MWLEHRVKERRAGEGSDGVPTELIPLTETQFVSDVGSERHLDEVVQGDIASPASVI